MPGPHWRFRNASRSTEQGRCYQCTLKAKMISPHKHPRASPELKNAPQCWRDGSVGFDALPEDLSLILSILAGWLTIACNSSARGSDALFLASVGIHTHVAYTHTDTDTQTLKQMCLRSFVSRSFTQYPIILSTEPFSKAGLMRRETQPAVGDKMICSSFFIELENCTKRISKNCSGLLSLPEGGR